MEIKFDAPYGLSMDECIDVCNAVYEYNQSCNVLSELKKFAFFNKYTDEAQKNFFDAVMYDLKNADLCYWNDHEIERTIELVAIRRGIDIKKGAQ